MKNFIYCTTTANGEQSFYLTAQGTKYFLFAQAFKRSNKDAFGQGISLFELRKLKKHCSYSVRHTAEKLPVYIRYIEQEYGVLIMEKTKRKNLNRQDKKRFGDDDYINGETA